jgi:hypothetical protein
MGPPQTRPLEFKPKAHDNVWEWLRTAGTAPAFATNQTSFLNFIEVRP